MGEDDGCADESNLQRAPRARSPAAARPRGGSGSGDRLFATAARRSSVGTYKPRCRAEDQWRRERPADTRTNCTAVATMLDGGPWRLGA